MSYIMQQNGDLRGFAFFIANVVPLALQCTHRLPHQVHGAKGMMKAGVQSPRIHVLGEP